MQTDLVATLRNALQTYCDKENIFIELIQNAEDAHASKITFLIDENYHRETTNVEKRLQRPALLIFNDSYFSEGDKENIRKLNNSDKISDPTSVGRFGLGFNTVYHISGKENFFFNRRKIY